MSTSTARPLAALAGAAFCVLGIAGTLVGPSEVGFAGAPDEIVARYTGHEDALLASNTLYLLAGVLLLVFAGFLRSVIGRAEGGDGRIATTAFGGFVAGATLSFGAAALDTMGALRVSEQGSIAPEVATVLFDGSSILYGLAAPMGLAVGVLACAIVAFRTGILPTWLAAVSAVLGVALLVPPINYMAVIAFTFWALATGVTLYLKAAPSPQRAPAGIAGATA